MSRLPCVTPVHRVRKRFRTGVLRVPAGTRPSLRPFFEEGVKREQSSGEMRRENEKACLQFES
jgi:hypothetical protein